MKRPVLVTIIGVLMVLAGSSTVTGVAVGLLLVLYFLFGTDKAKAFFAKA